MTPRPSQISDSRATVLALQSRASSSSSPLLLSPPPLRSCLLLCTLLLSGCAQNHPFFEDTPRHTKVSAERLRAVEKLSLDRYRKPTDSAAATVDTAALKAKFDALTTYDVTLETARASVLENNLDLKVAFMNPTIAAQSVREEESRFEALFTTRMAYASSDQPTSSQLNSAQSTNLSITPGISKPLETGGNVSARLPFGRNTSDNSFSTLNPAYTSDLELSISQPLLRNAGRRNATAGIRIAKYNQQVSESQAKLEAIRQLAAIDRAYWRLYRAQRELDVAMQQQQLAQTQLDSAKRQVKSGAAAEIEVLRAEAGVASRVESIIVAQNSLQTQQREFKRVMNTPGLTVDTQTRLVLKSEPDPVEYLFERNELLDKALATRMEMLELELRLAADVATINLEKNRALPLLTLDYTYRINGLGGSTQDAFHTLERNKFEDWQLGLNLEVPLGNEAAKSRVRRAILSRLQRLATKEARELAIRQEVLNAIDELDSGWQRIFAARTATALNTRTLQAEQRQFNVGQSTSTNVLDAATRLAESQLSEIRAITDYQVAQVDLAFATGTLLGAAKVEWQSAPEPAPDITAKPLPEKLPESLLTAPSAIPTTAPTPVEPK